jgi:hypothetical protein
MNLLEQLKKLIEQGKDDKDVQSFLGEMKKVNKEDVIAFLGTDEGKKILQPINDAFFTKGLKTWQDSNLQKIKDDAVAASKNETPEQKQIRELNEKFNNESKLRAREAIKNKVLQSLTSKGLPTDLADLVSKVETEEEIPVIIETLEKTLTSQKENLTAEFQKSNGRTVVSPGKTKLTKEILKTMTPEQVAQFPQEEINAVIAQG